MYTLNKKIINLVPYEPISGTYDIRLDANECPDNLPEFIREDIKAEIDKLAFNRYPDPMASSVVEAFASYYGINSALVTAGKSRLVSDDHINIFFLCFFYQFCSKFKASCNFFNFFHFKLL